MRFAHVVLLVAIPSVAAAAGPGLGERAPDFELAALRFYDFRIDERPIMKRNAGALYREAWEARFHGLTPETARPY